MKGIAQEFRDHKWHSRHTKKLAAERRSHKVRAYAYSIGETETKRQTAKAEFAYQEARKREALRKFSLWQHIKMFFNNLFSFSKFKIDSTSRLHA